MTSELNFKFKSELLSLNRVALRDIFKEAVLSYGSVQCIDRLITPTLEEIGKDWENGKVALSQIYMSSRICEELVDTILTKDNKGGYQNQKIAIAVLNDHHILGKKIVYSILRTLGYEVRDYGGGTSIDMLVERVKVDDIKILLISVLMLPSALLVKDLKSRLVDYGYNTKLIVGGAPFRFDKELWKEVGADAMGYNASDAIKIVKEMTQDKVTVI